MISPVPMKRVLPPHWFSSNAYQMSSMMSLQGIVKEYGDEAVAACRGSGKWATFNIAILMKDKYNDKLFIL
jgi:hypothetical protein